MKRLLALLITLLLAPACAAAITNLEWHSMPLLDKMARTATTYEYLGDDPHVPTTTDLSILFRAVGTIPGGTYVSVVDGMIQSEMIRVEYEVDSGRAYAWVHEADVVNATMPILLDNGETIYVPERVFNAGEEAFMAYMNDLFYDKKFEKVEGTWVLHVIPVKKTSRSASKPTAAPAETLDIALETQEGSVSVTVQQLGSYASAVLLDGAEAIVSTADLRYVANVEPEQALAVIYAANTGEVTLRPQAEKSGKVTVCRSGRIALVLEAADEWTKIWYDGYVGYVPTRYVQFIPVADAADAATVAREEDKKAPMHLKTHRDSLVVTRVENGAQAQVFSVGETWAEVEYGGFRGYIQMKYLNME